MMMKPTIYIAFLVLFCGCQSEAEPIKSNSPVPKTEEIKYTHQPDSTVVLFLQEELSQLPTLILKEIELKEYDSHSKMNTSLFLIDSNKMELTDSTIILRTSSSILNYPRQFENEAYIEERGYYWLKYNGFNHDLKFYHVEEWQNGEFTLGRTLLIDSLYNIVYALESQTDGVIDRISVSPDSRFLACISHEIFDNNTYIQMISTSAADSKFRLHNHASALLQNQVIIDIHWISNFEFAIVTSESIDDNKFRYFIINITD